jgi:peptide/nickel transport system substrate-binding protein
VGRLDERETPLLGDGLGRRQFIGGLAGTGAVAGMGGLLAACGGSSSGGSASASAAPSSSSGSAAGGPQKRGGNLRVGLTGGGSNDTLDPHSGLTYLDTGRAQALYNPLYQLNADAVGEYVLAVDNGITPNNKDNTEWTIELRPGVKFHNGKPLTANDVIYTFRRILNTKPPFSGASSLGPMDVNNLKADGDLKVIVPFTSPYGSFVDQLAFWYYLYIIPEGFDPKKSKPNGTGPFKYQSFTPGQRSVFVRNDNYFRPGRPFVDQLTIIDFPDPVSLQNALVTNVIDAAGAIEGPQVASLSSNSNIKTIASKTGAITPFTMRRDIAPFNNVNVRQAMRYLVDRQQLIDSALDGFATVAADVFSPFDDPSYHGFTREVNIPKAKFLLKQAGQSDLTVQLVTSAVATGTVAMATVLAQQAKAAGVTINVKNVSPSDFFAPTIYLKSAFSQDFYNTSPYLAQVAQSMLKASPFNETHTDVPQYNKWYADANKTTNASTRNDIKHEMREFDFNQGAYVIPAFIDALDAYSTKLTGYTPARVGQPLSDVNFESFSFV